eukprot:scaffold4470_cov255-Prasinococcus_capsulatus_cf.AAC.9
MARRPWARDPHYFKHVRISALALIKMTMHTRAGGNLEVMGMLQVRLLVAPGCPRESGLPDVGGLSCCNNCGGAVTLPVDTAGQDDRRHLRCDRLFCAACGGHGDSRECAVGGQRSRRPSASQAARMRDAAAEAVASEQQGGGPPGEHRRLVPQPPGLRLLDVRHRLRHADRQPAGTWRCRRRTDEQERSRLALVFHRLTPALPSSSRHRTVPRPLPSSSCGSRAHGGRGQGGDRSLPDVPRGRAPGLKGDEGPLFLSPPLAEHCSGRCAQGYKPPDEQVSEYQSIPLNKIEDFGVHAKQYYSLDISYFKSSLDAGLLDLLWNKYWINTLSSTPLLGNRDFMAGQLADVGTRSRTLAEDRCYRRCACTPVFPMLSVAQKLMKRWVWEQLRSWSRRTVR